MTGSATDPLEPTRRGGLVRPWEAGERWAETGEFGNRFRRTEHKAIAGPPGASPSPSRPGLAAARISGQRPDRGAGKPERLKEAIAAAGLELDNAIARSLQGPGVPHAITGLVTAVATARPGGIRGPRVGCRLTQAGT